MVPSSLILSTKPFYSVSQLRRGHFFAQTHSLTDSPLFSEGSPGSSACHLGLSTSVPQLVFLHLPLTYSSTMHQPKIEVFLFLTHLSLDGFALLSGCRPTVPSLIVKILSDGDQDKSVCQ